MYSASPTQSRGPNAEAQNNKIGPSKSDCIGEEIIVVEDPEKAFEIKSSTQTPDVPSGKRYVQSLSLWKPFLADPDLHSTAGARAQDP